jgi:hypothetical protein
VRFGEWPLILPGACLGQPRAVQLTAAVLEGALMPTTPALRLEMAATASRSPAVTGSRVHAWPSQRKISTRGWLSSMVPAMPTAHAFADEIAVTLLSALFPGRLGLGTRDHPAPFQCKISVRAGFSLGLSRWPAHG